MLLARLLLLLLAASSCSATGSPDPRRDSAEETTAAPQPPPPSLAAGSRLRSSAIARPRLFCRTCWVYGVLTVATSPLTRPSGVAALLRTLRLPLGASLRGALLSACAALYRLRQRYEWSILMWHEAFTSLSADLLAQALEGHGIEGHGATGGDGDGDGDGGSGGGGKVAGDVGGVGREDDTSMHVITSQCRVYTWGAGGWGEMGWDADATNAANGNL